MISIYKKIAAPIKVQQMTTGHLPQFDDPDRLVDIIISMLPQI